MTDRSVQFPNRYQFVPVAGTTDTFDLVPVPGVVSAEGDDLSKANLLKDATAEALKLLPANNPKPDDAFLAISAALPKVGSILQTVDTNPGDEYVLCNGALYDVDNDYPALAAVSTFGSKYEKLNRSFSSLSNIRDLVYTGTYYVFMGAESGTNYLYYTTNLSAAWTRGTAIPSGTIWYLSYVNGYLVVLYYNSSTNTPFIAYMTTPNGTFSTKEIINSNEAELLNGKIVWTGSYYVIPMTTSSNPYAIIFYCTTLNGTWTQKTIHSTACNAYAFDYINNTLVMTVMNNSGNAAYLYYIASANPSGTWTQVSLGTYIGLYGVIHDGTRWIIAATTTTNYPVVLYSTSIGSGWQAYQLSSAYSVVARGIIYYKNQYCMITTLTSNNTLVAFWSDQVGSDYTPIVMSDVYINVSHFKLVSDTTIEAGGVFAFVHVTDTSSGLSVTYGRYAEGHLKTLPTISLTEAYAFIKTA